MTEQTLNMPSFAYNLQVIEISQISKNFSAVKMISLYFYWMSEIFANFSIAKIIVILLH